MAYQIEEDLWCIQIPLEGNPLKTLNSYLLKGAERSLLIDTGFRHPKCLLEMETQLHEIGVDRSNMDIFLTHAHSDHTGLAPKLLQGSGQILISKVDGAVVTECLTAAYWTRNYQEYLENGFSEQELFQIQHANPAQKLSPIEWDQSYTALENGDILRYGKHVLHCISTPGHSPGHMCLYEAEKQWLFSGDHVLFHISPNICRWEAMPDALDSYLESLRLIQPLPVKRLFPAHHQKEGPLSARIDELLAHHRHRAQSILRVLSQEPGMTAYEIASRLVWNIRCKDWGEFPVTQKYFAVGETLAHLDYLSLKGKLFIYKENGIIHYAPVDNTLNDFL